MKALLLRKLMMYKAVLAVLNVWSTIWNQLSAFTENHAHLNQYINDIEKKKESLRDSNTITEEKNQRLDEMIDLAGTTCGAGASYAKKKKDKALTMSFNYTASALESGTEDERYMRCLTIAEAAEPIKAELVKHNLTEDQFTEFKNLLPVVKELIKAPHLAIKGHKSTNTEMKQLFKDCDAFLKDELDRDMRTFRKTQRDFYAEYTTSREIGGWSKGNGKNGGNGGGDGGVKG